MPTEELIRTVVFGLPNFVGLLVALYMMREQNLALMQLIRECNERNAAKEENT